MTLRLVWCPVLGSANRIGVQIAAIPDLCGTAEIYRMPHEQGWKWRVEAVIRRNSGRVSAKIRISGRLPNDQNYDVAQRVVAERVEHLQRVVALLLEEVPTNPTT